MHQLQKVEGSIWGNASCITTGEFNAALIKTGVLMSANGKTWIDMDNGSFNFSDVLKLVDGKLVLSHTNSSEGITIDKGGIKVTTYSITNGMKDVAKIIASSFSKNRDQNGLSIFTTGYGDYIQIAYEKEDGTISVAAYFVPVGVPKSAGFPYSNAGIYFCNPIFIKSSGMDDEIRNLSEDFLCIYGDNGVSLGFKSGNTLTFFEPYEEIIENLSLNDSSLEQVKASARKDLLNNKYITAENVMFLEKIGNNIWNSEVYELGYIANNDTIVDDSNYYTSPHILIKGSSLSAYRFNTGSSVQTYIRIINYYDENLNIIKGLRYDNSNRTVEKVNIPSEATYIRIVLNSGFNNDTMIVYDDEEQSSYEPYKCKLKNIVIDNNNEEVENTLKDNFI